MTGTDLYKRTHKSVLVIFEPLCITTVFKIEPVKNILQFMHIHIQNVVVTNLGYICSL